MAALFFIAAGEWQLQLGPYVLGAGLVGLFVCSRLLSSVLAPVDGGVRPGMRAIGLWLPIAACTLVAMVMGRTEIAMGVVFGTSVGAMTTVVGFTALAEPIGGGPGRWRRLWPFPLAAALIVFVAGFKGHFGWRDAIALAIEGAVVLALWRDRGGKDEGAEATERRSDGATEGQESDEGAVERATWEGGGAQSESHVLEYRTPGTAGEDVGRRVVLSVEVLVAVAVAVLAAWAVSVGVVKVSEGVRNFSSAGIAATVVGLALVMPMTYGAWRRASGGKAWDAMTTQVGIVLLNLCVLLPICIALPYLASVNGPVGDWVSTFAGDGLRYGPGLVKPLIFPVAFWRVDNVLLIIVAVLLLPVAAGKWKLGKEEGMVLVAGYFFYLTAILWAARG
ncbi:MAG TPA: hypothetical protein VEA69_23300 [Tepidisphaeraceae bacterium]|nr:hypothetical protein [Tepidisphaeraceae bacterium]